MARPREDLLKLYRASNDVKKSFVVEHSKVMARSHSLYFSSETWALDGEKWIKCLDAALRQKYPVDPYSETSLTTASQTISDQYASFKVELSRLASQAVSNSKWVRPPFLVQVEEQTKLERLKRKLGLRSNREFLQWALLQEKIVDEVENRIESVLSYRLNKVFNAAVRHQNAKLKKLKEHLYELAFYQATDDENTPPEDLDELVNTYYRQLIKDIPELDEKKAERLIKANTSYKDIITDPALKVEDEVNNGKFERVSRDAVTLTISRETYNELAAVFARLGLPTAKE